MIENRIRDLRRNRKLSQERLGELVGMSKPQIWRLESGKARLDIDTAVRLSKALKSPLGDLIASDGDGFAEDAAPFQTEPTDPMARLGGIDRNLVPYEIKTNALSNLHVIPGDVLLIDISAKAVAGVKPMAIVIARLCGNTELLKATTLLRQFVPPSLLITNSSENNGAILDMAKSEVHIKGVVVSKHTRIT